MTRAPRDTRETVLTIMSSPAGRWARGIGGVALTITALRNLPWGLLGLPFGLMMVVTAIADYCPATTLLRRSNRDAQLPFRVDRIDAVRLHPAAPRQPA